MVQKFTKLKQKTLKLWQLHYAQKTFQKTADKNKTVFNGYVYDFSVDYDATDIDDILDLHTYWTKKNNIV